MDKRVRERIDRIDTFWEGTMKELFQTKREWDNLILRLTLAFVIFPHGAQKLFGWFGGFGFEKTIGFFTTKMGIPMAIAFLIIIGESLGALALVVGALTRLCALGIFVIMMGAIAMVHWSNGFFMNWFGKQNGEGFEYHLLVMAISLILIFKGGGKFSLDGFISDRLVKV